ncbi:MAG TPA: type II CAAX endopeptidase family protein, partial [Acidimicrobiales bacterium]|nr:type II CAAX endopeptidase family protein [Acidimicrobiales bacterium]
SECLARPCRRCAVSLGARYDAAAPAEEANERRGRVALASNVVDEALAGGDEPERLASSERPGTRPQQIEALGPKPPKAISRKGLVVEIWLVLGLSLGADAVYAVLGLAQSLTAGPALKAQTAVVNASAGTNSSLLNLAYELVGIAAALVPVALVVYLLFRSGESTANIGLDTVGIGKETLWGAALAAGVGGAGLALYLGAYHAGMSLNVVPTNLPPVWWRIPVLVLAAVENGVLEEVVVCGYLLHRLRQLQWGAGRSLVTSALLRGSYHLYQGFGGFLGNAAMGLLFGRLFQRKGRLLRLILAHSLIDTGAFVGYVLLHGHVSWLP